MIVRWTKRLLKSVFDENARRALRRRFAPLCDALEGRVRKGRETRVAGKAVLRTVNGGEIVLGDRCTVHDFAMLLTYGGKIVIGDDSTVNPFCVLYGHGGLTIGRGVRIAAHVVIVPANHRFDDPDRFIFEQGETAVGVVIEDDVWIGTGARILDGVRVGRGAVIGAGSVVTKDVPSMAVVAGVPARVIRYRGASRE